MTDETNVPAEPAPVEASAEARPTLDAADIDAVREQAAALLDEAETFRLSAASLVRELKALTACEGGDVDGIVNALDSARRVEDAAGEAESEATDIVTALDAVEEEIGKTDEDADTDSNSELDEPPSAAPDLRWERDEAFGEGEWWCAESDSGTVWIGSSNGKAPFTAYFAGGDGICKPLAGAEYRTLDQAKDEIADEIAREALD